MPEWLRIVAWISIIAGVLSLVWIAVDEIFHPQHMWIMNVVWPVTGLWASGLAVWAYYRYGRLATKQAVMQAKEHDQTPPNKTKPFPAITGVAATHCGSGCTLGDLCAEWIVFAAPVVLTWFGYRSLFDHKAFAAWILDFILAFAFGIAFQYFTIAPMRNLGPLQGLWQALKADTLSLTAWQIGMYGWMALTFFVIFGHELPKANPVFWFMMQIAMLCGFVLAFPVNWWLVRSGIKEKM